MTIPHAILDSNGIPVNRVLWDGVSNWSPPDGFTTVADPDGLLMIPTPEPEPIARWVEFGAAMGADPTVNAFVAAAAQAAPVLHLMLGVGLGQAAQGDTQTFLAAWQIGLTQGLVTPELAEHVIEIAGGFDLPGDFVQGLEP